MRLKPQLCLQLSLDTTKTFTRNDAGFWSEDFIATHPNEPFKLQHPACKLHLKCSATPHSFHICEFTQIRGTLTECKNQCSVKAKTVSEGEDPERTVLHCYLKIKKTSLTEQLTKTVLYCNFNTFELSFGSMFTVVFYLF